jgi:hypothetical protein
LSLDFEKYVGQNMEMVPGEEKFRSPDILILFNVRRLEWLGHVKMDGARRVKKVLEGKAGGRN